MNKLSHLCNLSAIHFISYSRFNIRCLTRNKFSTRPKEIEEIVDEGPVKFSKSPASRYKAKSTRTGNDAEPRLWYEPYVLIASISAFVLYFMVIREENDIDQDLNKSLYTTIVGLEEHQLKESLEYNLEHGLETDSIKNRLIEIENNKNESTAS